MRRECGICGRIGSEKEWESTGCGEICPCGTRFSSFKETRHPGREAALTEPMESPDPSLAPPFDLVRPLKPRRIVN